jgi:hypothetical protein
MVRPRRVLVFSALFVLGGCAFHTVPFTEPMVGYAMVWEEPSAAFPGDYLFALLGFVGDGSEAACRSLCEEVIARGTKYLSQRFGVTSDEARAMLEKESPHCAPAILRPASRTTANFAIALARRALFTQVFGWRTDLACRDGLAKMELAQLQCVPAFLIQAPSGVSMK